jgi:multidrug efflux system membrane fusion protein
MIRAMRDGALCLFCLSLFLSLAGCENETARQTDPSRRAVPVLTAKVLREDVSRTLTAVGNVLPAASVTVRPQVGGQIVETRVRAGQDVAEGDVLFQLDARPFEAAVNEVRARLERNTILLKKAEEDMARFSRLVRQDAVSREQYDQAVTDAQSQRAAVNQDESLLASTLLQLEYATITAPVAGRVGEILIDAGNVVKANDAALLVINTLSPARVIFAVPERHLPEIMEYFTTRGMTVSALPEGDTRPAARGKLTSIDNSVDTATGTIRLEATFPNEDHRLWPGQFVRVTLDLADIPGALVAPSSAVLEGIAGPYAYVVRDDMTVDARRVAVERLGDGRLRVAGGLDENETVVIDGQINLAPGAAVSLRAPQTVVAGGGGTGGTGAP